MITKVLGSIFGTKNDRELKRLRKVVAQINKLEDTIAALTDEQLKEKTAEFKRQFADGTSLDNLLPEAFAVCREASKRVLGMRHYDVQLIGGITLHEGKIAEMRTGEGKTLMSTLACYLNALGGNGVHVVTVNDYLASRDAELNRPLFEFLGLSVGVIYSMQPEEEKTLAYKADVTYGTNNEYGFDYLRDNMVFSIEDKKQRKLAFAIIDEIDSILIDEARTPLIISGASEDSSRLYQLINQIVPTLERSYDEEKAKYNQEGHFYIEEKHRQIEINEAGYEVIENQLRELGELGENESLYSPSRLNLLAHVQAAIRAHHIFVKNIHYIVQNGEVVIVDENTGRTMPGRRWSEGLHQAVEAKEGVNIQNENQTMASTTFQNYFRLYDKLGGMTGTADTEAAEFKQTYGLDVVVIPTHKPMVRKDLNDQIFLSKQGKYLGILKEIENIRVKNAPILVGTATIEASEDLSKVLTQAGIKHNVLNAKQHEREAEIVAQAGRPGAVTIATNMAGRGTDIILGGNWQAAAEDLRAAGKELTDQDLQALQNQWQKDNLTVLEAGGLHIIGSERHESRRIDNQLRGRAGRQGDPGMSRFFLSLEDDLMRIFAGDRVSNMMRSMGLKEDEAIEHKMVSRSIENAQRKVEARDFDARKNLLKYDDVANDQRKVVYKQRDRLLEGADLQNGIEKMHHEIFNGVISHFVPPGSVEEQWNIDGLETEIQEEFGFEMPINDWLDEDASLDETALREKICDTAVTRYRQRREDMGEVNAREIERGNMLVSLDKHWKDHLSHMDHLRKGIHLRGYAQKQPEQEYKRESFELFGVMLGTVKSEVVQNIARIRIQTAEEAAAEQELQIRMAREMQLEQQKAAQQQSVNNTGKPQAKINRNAVCPLCDSGKKYKHCCGKL